MRLLIAPDKFAGTLSALDVAEAVAAGWRRRVPDVVVDLAPLSDGGPGFVEVVRTAHGGTTVPLVVTGPLGTPVPAELLLVGAGAGTGPDAGPDAGSDTDDDDDADTDTVPTAYVEVAQACGLALVPAEQRDPRVTTTYGVGELIAAAIDAGAQRVVVGLGGSATNDGGAGMLAALGATVGAGAGAAAAADSERLRRGGAALAGLGAKSVDVGPALARLAGVELVAAGDVDNPLLGLEGASAVFGPQKGADRGAVLDLDEALRDFAAATDPAPAELPGAGAAGGLGFGLSLLGATRVPGIETVLDLVGLAERARAADVVVTGEGSLDWQSLRGKVVNGVAAVAGAQARPCVVVAGRVEVGRRELAAMGVSAAYSVTEQAGSTEAAMTEARRHLIDLADRIAGEWSRT